MKIVMKLCRRFIFVIGLAAVALGTVAIYGYGWLLSAGAHFLGFLPYTWEECAPMSSTCWMESYEGPGSFGGFMLWGFLGFIAAYVLFEIGRFVWIVCDEIGLIILKK